MNPTASTVLREAKPAQAVSLMMSEQTYKECSGCKASFEKYNINYFTSPHDGDAFYNELEQKSPDVALLEVFMPGLDALAVKKKYDQRHNNGKTVFFATGPFFSDNIIKDLIGNGFGYYFMRPFHPDSLSSQISTLTRDEPKDAKPSSDMHKVTLMLRDLGMPAHLLGYHYVRQAISLVLEKPSVYGQGMFTRRLYPDIAEQNHTSPSRVERGIRHAIETVFDRSQPDKIEKYFGSTVRGSRGKATNSEFIMMLVDQIMLFEKAPQDGINDKWL